MSASDGRAGLSMPDGIVLAGTAAVEKAARDAGYNVTVPFTGGRGDATHAHELGLRRLRVALGVEIEREDRRDRIDLGRK